MKIDKLCILMVGMALTAPCFSKPLMDNEQLINKAVNDFFVTYNKSGISGLPVKITNCYKNSQTDKRYCLYLDYTAKIFDANMVAALNEEFGGNAPTYEYFDDDKFGERVGMNVYLPMSSNFEETNSHLEFLYHKLMDKIVGKIESQ